MEVKSVQKFVIMSPRKLRVVAELIGDLSPAEAFRRLPYIKKRASIPLKKVVGCAIANAKQIGLKESDLVFKEIQINEGPRLKRWRAGARGAAKPYNRRMSHIRVVLTTKPVLQKKETKTSARGEAGKSQIKGVKVDKSKDEFSLKKSLRDRVKTTQVGIKKVRKK